MGIKLQGFTVVGWGTESSKMKAGTDYRYTLSLHNDILIPEDITIEDWENGGNQEGDLKDITT